MAQELWPLVAGGALIAVNLSLLAVVRNGVIKRRLRFMLWTTLVYIGLHLAGAFIPGISRFDQQRETLERLLLVLAVTSGAVSLVNPWFREGVPDRIPSILQDTIILSIFGAVAVGWFHEQLAMTSAVGAAVIGFAAQDTLGNAFAGLAIQIDRPFRVGHWITVGAHEGLVTEITWRATKVRTKAGNQVVIPNNVVARESINNYSEPQVPTRIAVEIGASYDTPPNETKAALLAAVRESAHALADPEPDVLLVEFGASAITYRVRFWIADFGHDDRARDQVRTFIYYELRRRGIDIPYPIQVQYAQTVPDASVTAAGVSARMAQLIAGVPVLAVLPEGARAALASSSREQLYAADEVVVREGDAASSMYLVARGRVDVTLASGDRVATTDAGGYFGEMSLLTGAPRSATVRAVTDCSLVEISAASFRQYVQQHPDVLADLAAVAARRRQELDAARASAAVSAETSSSLLQKMREFFGL